MLYLQAWLNMKDNRSKTWRGAEQTRKFKSEQTIVQKENWEQMLQTNRKKETNKMLRAE